MTHKTLKFLVADDSDFTRAMNVEVLQIALKDYLSSSASTLQVDEAIDGRELIRLGSTNNYDGIISDVEMPYAPGDAAIQELRTATIRTRVLFYSSIRDQKRIKNMTESLEAGFMYKDGNVSKFISEIHKIWPEFTPARKNNEESTGTCGSQ